jgi:hypothetical protein
MMQILNQLDQDQDMRKEENLMKREINIKDIVTQEVLVEIKVTRHLLTQLEFFMHMRNQGAVQKCLVLGTKEEDMSQTACKDILGRLIYHPLMVKEEVTMMLKLGYLGSKHISN